MYPLFTQTAGNSVIRKVKVTHRRWPSGEGAKETGSADARFILQELQRGTVSKDKTTNSGYAPEAKLKKLPKAGPDRRII